MNQEPLLLNCPLCDGPAGFETRGQVGFFKIGFESFEAPDWTCGCRACGLWLNKEIGSKWIAGEGTKNTEAEAKLALAHKWNRRAVKYELNDPEKND